MYSKPEMFELGSATNLIQGEKTGDPEMAAVDQEIGSASDLIEN